eukprot:4784038-Amphidinium_carterae.3
MSLPLAPNACETTSSAKDVLKSPMTMLTSSGPAKTSDSASVRKASCSAPSEFQSVTGAYSM